MPVWAAKCSKPYYERRTYFPTGAGYFISRTLGHKAGRTAGKGRPNPAGVKKPRCRGVMYRVVIKVF